MKKIVPNNNQYFSIHQLYFAALLFILQIPVGYIFYGVISYFAKNYNEVPDLYNIIRFFSTLVVICYIIWNYFYLYKSAQKSKNLKIIMFSKLFLITFYITTLMSLTFRGIFSPFFYFGYYVFIGEL